MKYQLSKHKELWDKIITHLESMDFSMGFKPFHTLYTDYCIFSMGLRYESYACEYAISKAPYSYYMAYCKYCPAESCVVHKCGTDCLYMKVVHAYINHDKVNAIKYAKLIRDILAKEGVEIE